MTLQEAFENMALPEVDKEALHRLCCSQCGLPEGCNCTLEELGDKAYTVSNIITKANEPFRATPGS